MKLVKVDVELEDSILNGFIPGLKKTRSFFIKDSYTDAFDMNEVFSLYISLKSEQKVYKRKVYSLLDMIGDVGGLHEALFLLGSFLLHSYNACMFDLALVGNLFKFQKRPIKLSSKIQQVSKLDLI